MPATFDDNDCYELFIVVDNVARARGGKDPVINRIRDQLLPVYVEWHRANRFKIHPSLVAR